MSSQLYSYITRSSFVLAAIAVLCVDRFPKSIIPTVVMIFAALISAVTYTISRFKPPLECEDDGKCLVETTEELVSDAAHIQNDSQGANRESLVRPTNSPSSVEIIKRGLELERAVATLAQEALEEKTMFSVPQKRRVFIGHSYSETKVWQRYMAVYTQTKAHHSSAAAAVEIAKSLGSAEYDVTLTPDGTIKISRVARSRPVATTSAQNKQQSFKLDEGNPAYPIQ